MRPDIAPGGTFPDYELAGEPVAAGSTGKEEP